MPSRTRGLWLKSHAQQPIRSHVCKSMHLDNARWALNHGVRSATSRRLLVCCVVNVERVGPPCQTAGLLLSTSFVHGRARGVIPNLLDF